MLVLSRRPQEQIVLPTLGITVRVVSIQGNVVRLGIEAPPQVGIFRAELLETSLVQAQAGAPGAHSPGCP